jgi:GNAT superfamily N-acetyltransferase
MRVRIEAEAPGLGHDSLVHRALAFGVPALAAYTWSERPDLADRAEALEAEVWPEYNLHGDVMAAHWGRLGEAFSDFQFVVVDEAADEVVAEGHSIPCAWDGTIEGLPAGIDAAIAEGVGSSVTGEAPTALCALAIEIHPSRQGAGLSSRMVQAMAALGAAHSLGHLIAPVRPSFKERYPITPIERYARWRREDGLPLDPWMRVHARLGGEVLRPEPRSLQITGTVAEWERWTGLAFPESGQYVFPRGLAPVWIDREADLGTYFEPGVWMRHRLGGSE